MIKTQQEDGFGSGVRQRIYPTGASYVTSNMIPPFGEPWPVVPFVQQLKNVSGSSDMRVNGSLASPVDFFVTASNSADRFITAISFIISDGSATLNEFGHIGTLPNGCLLLYETPSSVTQVLPALKTNMDFIRTALGQPSFGTGAAAFQATNGGSGDAEAYIPTLRFVDWLPPFGLKLDINSGNRIILRVRDNVSTVDTFDAIVFGFDRVPEKHQKPITIKVP